MDERVRPLAKKIGVPFMEGGNLLTSVVHRSYLNEHPDFGRDHNERLEFLGDAVLELVVTEYLYLNYPNPEGELTNWRAALVNGQWLADIANTLELESYLLMSRGEQKDKNSKARRYILANAMEAVIGALYLDFGWDEAKRFVTEHVISTLPKILDKQLHVDPKSKFQEESQSKLAVTPSYKVLEESGPDHKKTFRVGVYLGRELVAEGVGTSKQEAQVDAAKKGLEAKNWA